MALPELTVPELLPQLLGSDHGIEQGDVYGRVDLTRRRRVRRLRTIPHRVVSVKWDLTSDQMGAFYRWYEEDLAGGVRQFSVQVANQGPGLLWWRAEWEEPYKAEPSQTLDWFVTGRIRLLGEGSVEGPVDTGLHAEVGWSVYGSVVGSLAHTFASEYSWAFTTLSLTPLAYELAWAFTLSRYATSVGSAVGSSTAEASAIISGDAGFAAGTSSATAVGLALVTGVGVAAGSSNASAVPLGAAVGLISGNSTASAVGRANSLAAGTAAGTSSAVASSISDEGWGSDWSGPWGV
jgi:hypothetical protein